MKVYATLAVVAGLAFTIVPAGAAPVSSPESSAQIIPVASRGWADRASGAHQIRRYQRRYGYGDGAVYGNDARGTFVIPRGRRYDQGDD